MQSQRDRFSGMSDEQIAPVHVAQLINYLCTTGIEHGLLINFGSPKFEIVKLIYTINQLQGETLT